MGSCMQQEDLMGKVKSLVLKCVQGAKPLASITKTMTKYRLGLQLEHGRARWGAKISLGCTWRVFWAGDFFSLVLYLKMFAACAQSLKDGRLFNISYPEAVWYLASFYFFCPCLCFDLSYAIHQAFLFWDDRDRPERHLQLSTAGVGRFTPWITWSCSVPVRAREWNNGEVLCYGVEWYKVLHTSKPAPGFLFVMVWCMLCNEPMVHVFKVAD